MKLKTVTSEIADEYKTLMTKVTDGILSGQELDEVLDRVHVLETEYDWFDQVFEENGKKGLRDVYGKLLIPALFDSIGCRYNWLYTRRSTYPVTLAGEHVIVRADGTGALVSEERFVSVSDIPFTLLRMAEKKDGTRCILASDAEVIVDGVDKVYEDFNGLTVFEAQGKMGAVVTSCDNAVIPVEYDEFDMPAPGDPIRARRGDVWGCFAEDSAFIPEGSQAEEEYEGDYLCADEL